MIKSYRWEIGLSDSEYEYSDILDIPDEESLERTRTEMKRIFNNRNIVVIRGSQEVVYNPRHVRRIRLIEQGE